VKLLLNGFLGYNLQRDNIVYGVVLAYATGDINRSDGGGRPDNTHTYLADAKLRAGYSFGRTLVFGTVGVAASNWQENVKVDVGAMGLSYGAGVDVKVWKELFVGVEYVHRDLTSDAFPWSLSDEYFDSSLDSVELRIGWDF
jgi:opacity protein-like surface antigen